MLNWIEIWGMWRPSQHLTPVSLVAVLFKLFLDDFYSVAERTVLLKEATAVRDISSAGKVACVCQSNVHMDGRTKVSQRPIV